MSRWWRAGPVLIVGLSAGAIGAFAAVAFADGADDVGQNLLLSALVLAAAFALLVGVGERYR